MLKSGPENMRGNYKKLMTSVDSPARMKALQTIMKKHNISMEEAMHRQALRIIQSKA